MDLSLNHSTPCLPYPQKLSDRTGYAQNFGFGWSAKLGQASGVEPGFRQRACWRRLAASNVSTPDDDGDVMGFQNCTCMLQTCSPAHWCVQSQVWPNAGWGGCLILILFWLYWLLLLEMVTVVWNPCFRVYWLKSILIGVDGFSDGIEPGTCGQPYFFKVPRSSLQRWRMYHRRSFRTLHLPAVL